MIAFTWFYLIKVKTHLVSCFIPRFTYSFYMFLLPLWPWARSPLTTLMNKREYLYRAAQIKSSSFLHPGSDLPEQMLTHQIAPLWFKNADLRTNSCFPEMTNVEYFFFKNAGIREMAKDFLQLFAQEMSAFSDVTALSCLWWDQDLNSPFCN